MPAWSELEAILLTRIMEKYESTDPFNDSDDEDMYDDYDFMEYL